MDDIIESRLTSLKSSFVLKSHIVYLFVTEAFVHGLFLSKGAFERGAYVLELMKVS